MAGGGSRKEPHARLRADASHAAAFFIFEKPPSLPPLHPSRPLLNAD